MRHFKAAVLAGMALLAAGAGSAVAKDKMIGVSWSRSETADEAGMKAAIEAAGDSYVALDAQASSAKQLADLNSLLDQGADALIVFTDDPAALGPAIQRARAEGVPVVAYRRPIENGTAFQVLSDEKEAGRLEARALLQAKPEGEYVFLDGSGSDPLHAFRAAGRMEALDGAIAAGKIKKTEDVKLTGESPADAEHSLSDLLGAGRKADVVLATSEAAVEGVVAALEAKGLAGQVAVSGDASDARGLNRVARGIQTVAVWADDRLLGERAGAIASELASGAQPDRIANHIRVSLDEGAELDAVLVPPAVVTRDTLGTAVDKGWASAADICQGVEPNSVSVCQQVE